MPSMKNITLIAVQMAIRIFLKVMTHQYVKGSYLTV